MSTGFYFHSIRIENFRLFRDLEVSDLKRINIIGGFNGAGKSALLETLFFLVDLRNPICLVRPFSWRQTPLMGDEGLGMFFQDLAQPAKISYGTPNGKREIIIEKATLPPAAVSALSATLISGPMVGGSSVFAGNGLRIKSGTGPHAFESYLAPHGDGFAGTITKLGSQELPTCQLLSSNLRVSAVEMAEWWSDCIKQNKRDAVLSYLKILDPSVNNLTILYNGPNPTIYAERHSGMIPIDLLGDGFRNLLTTILSIFRLRNGIVLLDEVDTALHYTITDKYWEIVARAANEADCQIFATSHSREAILSAATGIERAGRKADFRYLRLEKADSIHSAVLYSHEDISIASQHGFEFR